MKSVSLSAEIFYTSKNKISLCSKLREELNEILWRISVLLYTHLSNTHSTKSEYFNGLSTTGVNNKQLVLY